MANYELIAGEVDVSTNKLLDHIAGLQFEIDTLKQILAITIEAVQTLVPVEHNAEFLESEGLLQASDRGITPD